MRIGWREKDRRGNRDILSEREFLIQILETCAQFPDLHNPSDNNGNCYYTANENTSGSLVNKHCLIGQWWVNQGFPESELPTGNVPANRFLAEHGFPQNICSLARLVQEMADRRPVIHSTTIIPPPWRDVAVRIKNVFAVELK